MMSHSTGSYKIRLQSMALLCEKQNETKNNVYCDDPCGISLRCISRMG